MLLTDLPKDENLYFLDAAPMYEDSLHRLILNPETKNFEFCTGGGQKVDLDCKGSYEIDGNKLILNYYENDKIETHIVTYNIIEEETENFNGYHLNISKFTITFDKSLYMGEYAEQYYPRIFYACFEEKDCDVFLYRQKDDRYRYFHPGKYDRIPILPEEWKCYLSETIEDDILIPLLDQLNEVCGTLLGKTEDRILLLNDREYFLIGKDKIERCLKGKTEIYEKDQKMHSLLL